MSSNSLNGLQNLIPNSLDGLFNINASQIFIDGNPIIDTALNPLKINGNVISLPIISNNNINNKELRYDNITQEIFFKLNPISSVITTTSNFTFVAGDMNNYYVFNSTGTNFSCSLPDPLLLVAGNWISINKAGTGILDVFDFAGFLKFQLNPIGLFASGISRRFVLSSDGNFYVG